MSVTLYNAVSQDGFIATPDGKEDFIPDECWDFFIQLLPKYDAYVISSKTYDAIQAYTPELLATFESTPIQKIVLTQDKNFEVKPGYLLLHSPRDVTKFGENILISGGPGFNAAFLNAKLVDTVVQYVLPVSVKEGIKQFAVHPDLTLVSETEEPFGILKTYLISSKA